MKGRTPTVMPIACLEYRVAKGISAYIYAGLIESNLLGIYIQRCNSCQTRTKAKTSCRTILVGCVCKVVGTRRNNTGFFLV